MSRRQAVRAAGVVLALTLLTTGCVGMPDSGPINESGSSAAASEAEAAEVDAVPPPPQAPPAEIAKGFLDAMASWPLQIGVARQYLSKEAAAAWNPDEKTITYEGSSPPEVSGTTAVIEIFGAEQLDGSGAWEGTAPEAQQELRFTMTSQDGEYRITNPENALFLPSDWFAQRFTQLSLYFFDQTGSILVPEPVFVPRGEQLASTLVDRLLQPADDLRGISRSFLPTVDAPLSVPVTDDGVAEVTLGGANASPPSPNDPDLARMLAQLGWTLRQVPGIRAVRLFMGGVQVRPPGNDDVYSVNEGGRYDPADAKASQQLYALQNGLLVRGNPEELEPAAGPFGQEGAPAIRSFAVSLDGSDVMAVSADGTALVAGPVHADSGRLRTVLSGRGDLLPPAFDFTDRVWVVDNTAAGAEVGYLRGQRVVELEVPGVSGRRVTSFLVSRDGTRFVAVVAGNEGKEIRAGRIRYDEQGQVTGAGTTRLIPVKDVQRARVIDVAWTSPTSIAVARRISPGTTEVTTVPVDGAPTESLSTPVDGRVVALAAAPDGTSSPYALTTEGLVDLDTQSTTPFFGGRLVFATYAG